MAWLTHFLRYIRTQFPPQAKRRYVLSHIRVPAIGSVEWTRMFLPIGVIGVLAILLIGQMSKGERGLLAWIELNRTLAERVQALEDMQAVNRDLEVRNLRLREDSLDVDYLEERARLVLGFGRADEIVIIDPE